MTLIRALFLGGLAAAFVALNPASAVAGAPAVPVDLDAGQYHTCVVTDCGGVECFGRNDHGQAAGIGAPNPNSLWAPAPIVDVTVGGYHTCALDTDGVVDCWGRNNYGQIVVPPTTFVSIDAGHDFNCGVRTDGHLECWGSVNWTNLPDDVEDFSAGHDHACYIHDNGNALGCVGSNDYGQSLGWPLPASALLWGDAGEVFAQVSAGGYHTCAVSNYGYTYCWGLDSYGATMDFGTPLQGWPGIRVLVDSGTEQVSAGQWGTCARWADDVACWGWPFDTHYVTPTWSSQQLAVGANHACSIESSDTLACFGNNAYGKATPPDLSNACFGVQQIGWPWS